MCAPVQWLNFTMRTMERSSLIMQTSSRGIGFSNRRSLFSCEVILRSVGVGCIAVVLAGFLMDV